MQSASIKINHLLESLDEEDYDKAVSYIEFLVEVRNREKLKKEQSAKNQAEVEEIVASLIGSIPDTGKTLEEYRSERLKKYEIPD
ncbi:MAG: hypothetical protein HFH78_09965 [Lachnospiraceae bacterium]|jgi:hypothetical protein|nr:hypothetical protein [Lachnospiraceae bacterium]